MKEILYIPVYSSSSASQKSYGSYGNRFHNTGSATLWLSKTNWSYENSAHVPRCASAAVLECLSTRQTIWQVVASSLPSSSASGFDSLPPRTTTISCSVTYRHLKHQKTVPIFTYIQIRFKKGTKNSSYQSTNTVTIFRLTRFLVRYRPYYLHHSCSILLTIHI